MRHAALACAVSLGLGACGREPTATTAPPGPELSAQQKLEVLASLPRPYNAGDLENGRVKLAMCRSCHTVTAGGANQVGPNLYGMFGCRAGTVEGYSYSTVMKASDFAWDGETLDRWLANPRTFMPGTKMTFAGLPQEKDRVDLIAYLMIESGYRPK